MPNYYCEYCKSSLTHNSMSVRKSHLIGKNHIRYYCEYYENEAKKLNLLEDESDELPYEMTLEELYKGIPGGSSFTSSADLEGEESVDINNRQHHNHRGGSAVQRDIPIRTLPPPSLPSFPAPPPSVYYYNQAETKKNMQEAMRRHSERK